MITVRREVVTDRPVDQVADYLSDFTTTASWDPHTQSSSRLEDDGPPAVGAQYVNVQTVLGRRTSLRYAVVDLVPRRRIRLEGSGRRLDATDTMTFEAAHPVGFGTLVTYEATFCFSGALGVIEPLLRPVLDKIADDGARGIALALDRL